MKSYYKNIEKEINQRISKRNDNKSKVDSEIREQTRELEEAKAYRDKMLSEGTKEQYLDACDKVTNITSNANEIKNTLEAHNQYYFKTERWNRNE